MGWLLALVIGASLLAGSASADGPEPSSPGEENCALGLARPSIVHPLRMAHAGIRPYTGWRYSQAVVGSLGYPDLNCNQLRTSSGRLQAFKRGGWRAIWGQMTGGWIGNGGGVARIIAEPGHADPGYRYVFNDCRSGGKGFHPVRIVLDVKLKDEQTRTVIEEEQYIFTVPTKGNCKAAARSKQIAERQMEENYGV